MVQQIEIILKPKRRGFHLVTSEILSQLPKLPKTGIVNIFCKHTSSLQAKRTSSSGGLSINENADPDVRVDMETIFNHLVPENRPEYEHTLEGADDMPAHADAHGCPLFVKMKFTYSSLLIVILQWLKIYLR